MLTRPFRDPAVRHGAPAVRRFGAPFLTAPRAAVLAALSAGARRTPIIAVLALTLLVPQVPATVAHASSRREGPPLGKSNYAVALGGLAPDSRTNSVRLGQYTFAADGTVSELYWQWSQSTRVVRTGTGVLADGCTTRDCEVLTAGGWQTTDVAFTATGTYGVNGTRLRIDWDGGLWEEWRLTSLAGGELGDIELSDGNLGATHGFGNGSNASWDQRIPAETVAAVDQAKLVHRYYLWKTQSTPAGYQGYIDHGDGAPFWVPRWKVCADGRCLGAQTRAGEHVHTAYYVSPATASAEDRRDTLWHWHTELADKRGERCYTGNSHVKPMIQVVDDLGRFHGWVGVEASLNQTTTAGVNDDDIGVFRILG
ncbi:hypothetical protein [Actinomadura roseirufa]|uniref:hypothetical protein n=1 Tax=Actinomadura roseirufa TaxID=2094049 RepID=UPI0010416586|nr:hypothetical protein [Actinomadura roseirufa]